MDAATLQGKIYDGYSKAAERIGLATSIFRPASATTPLASLIGTTFASFTQNLEYSKFNKYGNSTWTALHDGSLTTPGDYMINSEGTWFIGAQQLTLPILAVQCNRVISVLRPTQPTGVGAVGYGGDIVGTEAVLMQGWPASVLQGSKGEKNPAGIPGDERLPWWELLFPSFPGVILNTSDVITDDLGRRYIISSPELTDLGWRIVASMQGA